MQTRQATSALHPDESLRAELKGDHERLRALFDKTVAAFQANERTDAAHLWSEFDAALQRHLELEERHILPLFAQVDPKETASLAHEHEEIRRKLLELGVGVDLHLARADRVEAFVRALEDHAAREDALMYRWAQANLPKSAEAAVRSGL